jgi:single-strand DNA-binding protein
MADLNSVNFTGRITQKPELRATNNGTEVLNARVAVNDAIRDESGAWTSKPNYINVSIYGPSAANLASMLDVGSRISVQGRLAWREWTTTEGARAQAVDIVANQVHMIDTKAEAEARRASNGTAQSSAPVEAAAAEEIPF